MLDLYLCFFFLELEADWIKKWKKERKKYTFTASPCPPDFVRIREMFLLSYNICYHLLCSNLKSLFFLIIFKADEQKKKKKEKWNQRNLHLWPSSLSSESPHFSASSGVGLQMKAERFFNKPISARFFIVWPIRRTSSMPRRWVEIWK